MKIKHNKTTQQQQNHKHTKQTKTKTQHNQTTQNIQTKHISHTIYKQEGGERKLAQNSNQAAIQQNIEKEQRSTQTNTHKTGKR